MKTNTQKGSVLTIVEIIAVVVLIVVGGIYYLSQTSNIRPLIQDVRVSANYPILNDESLWKSKYVSSNIPMQWNIIEKNVVLKEVQQDKFVCGDSEAQYIKYSSYNDGSIGGWNNISIVDCLDYFFIYEFGDAGPKLYGPFNKDSQTNAIVGNDRDEHGCIGSAGYSWSETKQACVRPWEEKQASSTDPVKGGVACTMEAKLCPDGSYVGRVGPNCEFKVCPSIATSSIPSITVISPNGGEVYKKGDTAYIRWNVQNIGNTTLEIDLLGANGTIVYNLSSMVSLTKGSQIDINGPAYSWAIPTDTSPGGRRIDSGQYKVRISLTGNSSVMDTSNNIFTITN